MALINPSALYTGGRVNLNPLPFEQIALQQKARKEAKEEALDKYFQDLPKSVNPAGLRTNDVPGFMDKINGIRDYYAKNREAIKNPRLDRGQAQAQYQAMNTDAATYVNTSKAEEAKKVPFVKVLANPELRGRVMDSDLQKLAYHDLPLNDPRRKSFDFSTIDYNPKELTPQENEAHQKALAAGFQPSEEVVSSVPNPQDLTITNTYQKKWSPEQLKSMVDKDVSTVLSDRRFEYNAQNLWDKLKNNPDQFKVLNETFKNIKGKDIENPAELHAAAQISGLMGQSGRQEIKPDENARDKRNFAQQLELQRRSFAHEDEKQRKQFENAKEKLGTPAEVNINDIYKNIEETTDNPNAAIVDKNTGKRIGTTVNSLNSDAQKVIIDYANKLRPNEKIGNDNIFINKGQDGVIRLYRTNDADEKDRVNLDRKFLIGELPKVTVNLPAQPGVKEKRVVINQGNTPAATIPAKGTIKINW